MKTYVVYENKIKYTVSNDDRDHLGYLQRQLKEGEQIAILDGVVSYDELKVENGDVVRLTEEEIEIRKINPSAIINGLSKDISDQSIDYYISNSCYGEPSEWRKKYYASFRKRFYPPMEDYLDAQAKINSGISFYESEGAKQLKEYYEKCIEVKKRFPK